MVGSRLRNVILWVYTATMLFAASEALAAGSATATFSASAVVASACTVNANNLTFGSYTPSAATALAANSTISVFCTSGTTYSIALNVGSAGGLFAARVLASGLNLLGYNIYTSATYNAIWGDGSLLTSTVSGTGVGVLTSSPSTVYGLIPTAQDLPPGTYTSTVTVTVNY